MSRTPLCPQPDGSVPSKKTIIEQIRLTLQAAGVSTTRPDGAGVVHERFGGHCLRVTGAQFLASSGIDVASIQLLGRWSSTAVEPYTQQAGLVSVHEVSHQALSSATTAGFRPAVPATPAPCSVMPGTPGTVAGSGQRETREVRELRQAHSQLSTLVNRLESDLTNIQAAMVKNDTSLVVRSKSTVVHKGLPDEIRNSPCDWRTFCGWQYGCARFFRVAEVSGDLRKCRKCFPSCESDSNSASEEAVDHEGQCSSSGTSDSSEDD